ncbi:hypothetical protein HDU93_005079 [Gonapodya sp. JEL0774]|nr:hypothetical protein HDU93_005079 [Gonapodya sp. JEL0774]
MGTFDVVTCLDCAYHFQTRYSFLKLAYRDILGVRGSIALADIIGGDVTWTSELSLWNPISSFSLIYQRILFQLFLLLASVPQGNLWNGCSAYDAHMRRVGFTDVAVTDISNSVFPGFLDFLDHFRVNELDHILQNERVVYPLRVLSQLLMRGVLWLLRGAVKRRWLIFVLVIGRK